MTDDIPIDAKKFGRKEAVRMIFNDKKFNAWYCNEGNLKQAQDLFLLWSIVSLHAVVKNDENVYQHLQCRVIQQLSALSSGIVTPPFMSISTDSVKDYRRVLVDNVNISRSLLKVALVSMTEILDKSTTAQSRAFYEYAIKIPFDMNGFHLIKQLDSVASQYQMNPLSIESLMTSSNDMQVVREYRNYLEVKKQLMFYERHPSIQLGGTTFTNKYYRYTRNFEGRCFIKASAYKNTHIIAYAICLSGI